MKNEKEYIDREAVLTVLKAVFDKTDPVGEEQFGVLKAHRIVREAPAADVVEVVRCKNCKYAYINSFSAASGVVLCKKLSNEAETAIRQQDEYCSHGERKEE